MRFNAQKPNTGWNATRSVKRNQNSHKIKFQVKGWMAGWLDGWAGERRLLSGFGTPTTICNGHRTMDNGHVTRQERVRVPLDPGTPGLWDTFLAPRRRDSGRVWVGSALRERWQSSSRSVVSEGSVLFTLFFRSVATRHFPIFLGVFPLFSTFIGGGFDAQINPRLRRRPVSPPASQVFPYDPRLVPGPSGWGAPWPEPDNALDHRLVCTIPYCLAFTVLHCEFL